MEYLTARSVANWWHDPIRTSDYLSKNIFLPIINGLVPTANLTGIIRSFVRCGYASRVVVCACDRPAVWKSNFLRVGHVYLLGSPDGAPLSAAQRHGCLPRADGDLVPWFTSQFAFFNSSLGYEPMEMQTVRSTQLSLLFSPMAASSEF
jgi:hypothetical protein